MQTDHLKEFFRARGRSGIVALIAFLEGKSAEGEMPIVLKSIGVLDNERRLDEVTSAMGRFGFEHCPAWKETGNDGRSVEWRKSLTIGWPQSQDGGAAAVNPLAWIELFSQVADSVSSESVTKFDVVCADLASIMSSPQPDLDIANL